MKIKVAIEARIDARDRRLCLESCPWYYPGGSYLEDGWCRVYDAPLKSAPPGRPLRCRQCLNSQVSEITKE
jgi:hypothetical protein